MIVFSYPPSGQGEKFTFLGKSTFFAWNEEKNCKLATIPVVVVAEELVKAAEALGGGVAVDNCY